MLDHVLAAVLVRCGSSETPASASEVAAVEWLASYLDRSANIASKFLDPVVVQRILKPLIAVCPYTSVSVPLFRVAGSDRRLAVGYVYDLKPNKVTSFTTLSSPVALKQVADQIGALDWDYCYVTQLESRVLELSNAQWLKTVVAPWVRRKLRVKNQPNDTGYTLEHFLEMLQAFGYQREVLAFSSSPIRVRVVRVLQERKT